MAAKEIKKGNKVEAIERTYNVPLRKEFLKVPRWNRAHKAVKAMKEFLVKHMKSDDVKISTDISKAIWYRGALSPPHHVKITVTRNDKNEVRAELYGAKKKVETKGKKVKNEVAPEVKKEVVKEEVKKEN